MKSIGEDALTSQCNQGTTICRDRVFDTKLQTALLTSLFLMNKLSVFCLNLKNTLLNIA